MLPGRHDDRVSSRNFYMGGCGEYMKKLRATEADGLKDYILS